MGVVALTVLPSLYRVGVEFFVYGRDRAGTGALRERLVEAHWSFMDRYADAMIARGPTLTEDGAAATGSVHIVDLPSLPAARIFAFDEPNFKAGVYESVLVRRFRRLAGDTMWTYHGADHPRYLVLGAPLPREGVIVGGELLSDDDGETVGTAALLETPDRAAFDGFEIHPWRFGGRPAA
jgi:uncharacterized protein YciI